MNIGAHAHRCPCPSLAPSVDAGCTRRRARGIGPGRRARRAGRAGRRSGREAAEADRKPEGQARGAPAGAGRRRDDDHRRRDARAPRPRRCRSARSPSSARSGSASAPTNRTPQIKDFVPLAGARRARCSAAGTSSPTTPTRRPSTPRCSTPTHLDAVRDELEQIKPMSARLLSRVREAPPRHAREDRRRTRPTWSSSSATTSARFMRDSGCARAVAVWCGSTEIYHRARAPSTRSIARVRGGPRENDPGDLQLADLRLGLHQGGRALRQRRAEPHRRFPRRVRSSRKEHGVPIAGKDFKTGQTLMKTVHRARRSRRACSASAAGSRPTSSATATARCSTIPDSFKTKEVSKLGVLEHILAAAASTRSSTASIFHKVRIEYYPPRGDAKEGWDNIDIFGWLGYPMQIKINFLCRDSILAAPIVLDLALLHGSRAARRLPRHPGVAELLLQEPDDRARASTRSTISSSSR